MRSNVKTAKRVGVGLSKAPQMASVLSHQCELWVWSRTPHSVFCFFFAGQRWVLGQQHLGTVRAVLACCKPSSVKHYKCNQTSPVVQKTAERDQAQLRCTAIA